MSFKILQSRYSGNIPTPISLFVLAISFGFFGFTQDAEALTSLDDISSGLTQPSFTQPIVGPSNQIEPSHWSYKLLQKLWQQAELSNKNPDVHLDGNAPISRTEMAVALTDVSNTIQPELIQKALSEREQAQFDILKEEFQSEMNVLKARITSLETRVDHLADRVDRKFLADAQGKDEKKYPNIQLSGLFQAWESATLDNDLSDRNFRLLRVNPGIKGDISKNWKYFTNFNLTRSSDLLLDGYVDYTGLKNHVLRIGQFRSGLTYDGALRGPGKTPFTDLSQIGLLGFSRERGAAVMGSFKNLVDYQMGVYNGNGDNRLDDNNALSFGGRVTVRPLAAFIKDEKKWGKLELGGSFLEGGTGDAHKRMTRDRKGFEARYIHPKFEVGGEYLNFTNPNKTNGYGYYLEGVYKLNKKWQLVSRYDFLNPDKLAKHTGRAQLSAGINYLIPDSNIRLSLHYMHFRDQAFVNYGQAIRFMTQYQF